MNIATPIERDLVRDAVTGLPGREAVRARLDHWLAEGTGPTIHAALIGLRRFDTINLAYGAAAGDAALAEVAARLKQFAGAELDGNWMTGRSGGGQFLLISNEPSSRERWQFLAGQLADCIAKPIAGAGGVLRLSPRVALVRGLAGELPDSLLDRLAHTLATLEPSRAAASPGPMARQRGQGEARRSLRPICSVPSTVTRSKLSTSRSFPHATML